MPNSYVVHVWTHMHSGIRAALYVQNTAGSRRYQSVRLHAILVVTVLRDMLKLEMMSLHAVCYVHSAGNLCQVHFNASNAESETEIYGTMSAVACCKWHLICVTIHITCVTVCAICDTTLCNIRHRACSLHPLSLNLHNVT